MPYAEQPEGRRVYTPKEFMGLTGLSKTAVYQGIERGDIPSVRIGRRILIPKSAAHELLDGFRGGDQCR